jgi:beta-barrel assembly-enhancing protease
MTLALAAAMACSVPQEEEVRLGGEYARQVNEQLPILGDPAVAGYIQALGRDMASRTDRADLDWQFHVVDSPEVNAFALPGGFIYINRGLIERTQRLDQLAGVLGHEIGHVVQRHSVEQMQKASGTNAGIALLCTLTDICQSGVAQVAIGVGSQAFFARHSRRDEEEADAEAITNVVRSGIDPAGIPSMFQLLLAERRQHPGTIGAFFATHPLEESRIDRTRALVELLPAAEREGLVNDTPEYQRMLSRLRALPPAPAPRPLPP